MATQKLRGKDLKKLGLYDNELISLALNLIHKHLKHKKRYERLEEIKAVLDDPEGHLEGEFAELAIRLIPDDEPEEVNEQKELEEAAKPYRVYGKKFIDSSAIQQMDLAMSLPVTRHGALMPDAHAGYGLPIGGVLATENAVIPYGVGLDIGCRMALTVFDAPAQHITRYRHLLKEAMKENTEFGVIKTRGKRAEHEVLDREEFKLSPLLSQLQGKAAAQIGTSGSGNHFVEFGTIRLEAGNAMGIEAGDYLALLSHSGSRGLGATIAQYYTRVAMEQCRLPRQAQNLAWLDLDSEEGQEYWMAMNLAGDYAKACHDVIHDSLAKAIGYEALTKVENHHNFAWKEEHDGQELIVHRKGATPAAEGQLGIIPGTMSTPGFVVSGLGEPGALRSASHGAGRKMSRGRAKNTFTRSDMNKMLKHHGITLMGGGTDEAPLAYKDIDQVMAAQTDLIKVEGVFTPRIVRMDKG